jgi:transcription elongation factor Elf1
VISKKLDFLQKLFPGCTLDARQVNVNVLCPVCEKTGYSKKKLAIRVADGAFHCWRCDLKSGSIFFLLKTMRAKRDFYTLASEIYEQKINVDLQEEEEEVVSLPADFSLVSSYSGVNPDVLVIKNYLLRRGISLKMMDRYRIGFSMEFKRQAIVPSFDKDGNLNYYVARTVDEKRVKYQNPSIKSSSIIFNEIDIDWSQPIILCEGVFDMMKCGENSIPLMGSTLSKSSLLYESILKHRPAVFVALDSDMWNTKTQVISKELHSLDLDVKIVNIGKNSDPGSMTHGDFVQCMSAAKSFSWKDFAFAKLGI